MARYIEKIETSTLPVIALHGSIALPSAQMSFSLEEEAYIAAAEAAFDINSNVIICGLKIATDEKEANKLLRVGTVSKIKQLIKMPDGHIKIITEGIERGTVNEFRNFANYICADVVTKTITNTDQTEKDAKVYCDVLLSLTRQLIRYSYSDNNFMDSANTIKDPAILADFLTANILSRPEDKQKVLECFDPQKRIDLVCKLLEEEKMLLLCERKIRRRVQKSISDHQKEMYLREQLRVIKSELGETDDADEYSKKIYALNAPDAVKEKLFAELERLSKTPFGSSESAVLRSYLDTCLEIPWEASTKDRLDISAASKILEEDHDGLHDVKDRILEFLAVKELNPTLKNQILCLVGPPGVGKTSIVASIARAMKRKYVRVSLGGVRDEADIRGHRKTYVAAMPGRIVNGLIEAKKKNPVMLLDEIDKLTRDSHGDPSSALLEVLDGEQNHAFRDHFVEIPIDLSECFFIATANTLDTVPKPLLDRMEIIELKTYTRTEKLAIAKNHLIPKQLKRHGLNKRMLNITPEAVYEIIDFYTREAGVRSLERKIAELARKAARRFVEDNTIKSIKLTDKNIKEFLGHRKLIPQTISDFDEIGTVNGLAYTQAGGDVLKVEVAVLEGTGALELTGSLGDVMKESAKIALSLVRSIADKWGIDPNFHKTKDIHIHFPEGAVPKDGPSAGVTMVTALVSALSGKAVKRTVAMTGEISLRGKVLAIGGLKEKTMAAYAYGVTHVLIPRDNVQDLNECDKEACENLHFIPCDTINDVLEFALVSDTAESLKDVFTTDAEDSLTHTNL